MSVRVIIRMIIGAPAKRPAFIPPSVLAAQKAKFAGEQETPKKQEEDSASAGADGSKKKRRWTDEEKAGKPEKGSTIATSAETPKKVNKKKRKTKGAVAAPLPFEMLASEMASAQGLEFDDAEEMPNLSAEDQAKLGSLYNLPALKPFSRAVQAIAAARHSVSMFLPEDWIQFCMKRVQVSLPRAEDARWTEAVKNFDATVSMKLDGPPCDSPKIVLRRAMALDNLYYALNAHNSSIESPLVYFRKLGEALRKHCNVSKLRNKLPPSTKQHFREWGFEEKEPNALLELMMLRWEEGLWLFKNLRVALLKMQVGSRMRLLTSWQNACRDNAARAYAFASPNKAAVTALSVGDLTEMGAGTGYWASLLPSCRAFEAQVTDEGNEWHGKTKSFTKVEEGSAMDLIDSTSLLLCMPPPNDAMAEDTLRNFRGDNLFYVGEFGTGLTGNLEFHETLCKDWTLQKRVELPNWGNTAYDLSVWKRGTPDKEQVLRSCACGQPGKQSRWLRGFVVCSQKCLDAHRPRLEALRTLAHFDLLDIAGGNDFSRPRDFRPCEWCDEDIKRLIAPV